MFKTATDVPTIAPPLSLYPDSPCSWEPLDYGLQYHYLWWVWVLWCCAYLWQQSNGHCFIADQKGDLFFCEAKVWCIHFWLNEHSKSAQCIWLWPIRHCMCHRAGWGAWSCAVSVGLHTNEATSTSMFGGRANATFSQTQATQGAIREQSEKVHQRDHLLYLSHAKWQRSWNDWV